MSIVEKFFERLKENLLGRIEQDTNFDACGYFETISQNKDRLLLLIENINQYDYHFQYEEDDTEGYTDGKLIVYMSKKESEFFDSVSYHYEIQFCHDDRYWRYCNCKPDDEGYNELYTCCGNGCDWAAPAVRITKIQNIDYFSFNGVERDIWELQDGWAEVLKESEEKKEQGKIEYIDEQIKRLTERKNILLHK